MVPSTLDSSHADLLSGQLPALKSGESNLTQGHIAVTHGRFNHIRQVAPVYTPSSTPVGIRTILVLPPTEWHPHRTGSALLSRFEYIDCQSCAGVFWAGSAVVAEFMGRDWQAD